MYLHQGCYGFVAYVLDTWEERKRMIDDMSVVREYSDVFPEDLPGVPLER